MAVRKLGKILVESGTEFFGDRGMKLSASLSYYTVFSLGPLLLVVISLVGIFYGKDAVEGRIHEQIGGFVGEAAALQIRILSATWKNRSLAEAGL